VETAEGSGSKAHLAFNSDIKVPTSGMENESSSLVNNDSQNVKRSSPTNIRLRNSVGNENLTKSVVVGSPTDEKEERKLPTSFECVTDLTGAGGENISVGSQSKEHVMENSLGQGEAVEENSLGQDEAVEENTSLKTETGPTYVFSTPAEIGRVNHQDLIRIGIVHACFICSTALHIFMIRWFLDNCIGHLTI